MVFSVRYSVYGALLATHRKQNTVYRLPQCLPDDGFDGERWIGA